LNRRLARRSQDFGIDSTARALAVALLALAAPVRADFTWPEGQLLPTFPAPAQNQDHILLRTSASTWQAETNVLGHGTGRADGDGWLCQTGMHEPGHMIYGPYETGLPAGRNTARFRMLIDNNTADNAVQATIDVRDATLGTTLATDQVTRQEFTAADQYQTFALDFELPAQGHQVELRVHWAGGAYLKVDHVSVDRGSEDELVLFASLKGIVNRTQPRIFSYEGDQFAEGEYTWLQSLGLDWTHHDDKWSLISKYRDELAGIVIYDPAVPDTVNLATLLASQKNALVVAPPLAARLGAAPYNLPTLDDLRGDFANNIAVYDHIYDNLWPSLTHRVLMGLSPYAHKAAVREYAVALGTAVVWLDPNKSAESEVLNRFLSSMGPGKAYMGWWPEEGPGVQRGSEYGIATVASDYATNLTMHSGMPRTIAVKPIPPKPILENKIYVAFILSDGDNLQYVEHLMRKLWGQSERGQVPIGWTVSPAMLDAMPGALNYYHSTATANDNLISGPSGWGYGYPNFWNSDEDLAKFVAESDDYATRAGLRVVTVWNTITGRVDPDVGDLFAEHAPRVLGLTAQNTGGPLAIYQSKLPVFPLSCNYCTGEQAMREHIATASQGWDRNSPRFVLIQAQPWTDVRPVTFLNVKNSLNADHVVVRPDNWFQLLRQANGIPVEPIKPVGDGLYRLINRASGKCLAVQSAELQVPVAQVECDDDDAQRFRVTATSNGYVKIKPLGSDALVVDVEGGEGGTGEGPPVSLYHDNDTGNQQFQPVWEEGDDYHLIARHSDRCLDVPGGGEGEGLQIRQWTCNGADAQAFQFADPRWPPPVDEPDAGVDGGSEDDDGDGDGDSDGDGDGDSEDEEQDPDETGFWDDEEGDSLPKPDPGCGGCATADGAPDFGQLFAVGAILLLGRSRKTRRR
jgi:hypothetical protein